MREIMTRDHIQNVLVTSFKKVFDQGRADLMPGLVSEPYIQHNPLFPNGLEAIMGYLDWGGKETACADIFRLDADGKIIEHWEVLQPIPSSANNANTMF
jgi:predicted SnoaL-like aldol condensation-catalyzing enzyme